MLQYIVRNGLPWTVSMGHLGYIDVPRHLAVEFCDYFNLVHYTPTIDEAKEFLEQHGY